VRVLPLDLWLFRYLGLMLGAGMVVYAEGSPMASQAINASEFFRNESCGKCVPCRLGTQQLVALGHVILEGRADPAAREVVADLARVMELTSICGLGGVAFKPLQSLLEHFPETGDAAGRR
jgi:NADH:ubiquinone oxidoreductase subunit F (NADH-binding)